MMMEAADVDLHTQDFQHPVACTVDSDCCPISGGSASSVVAAQWPCFGGRDRCECRAG